MLSHKIGRECLGKGNKCLSDANMQQALCRTLASGAISGGSEGWLELNDGIMY